MTTARQRHNALRAVTLAVCLAASGCGKSASGTPDSAHAKPTDSDRSGAGAPSSPPGLALAQGAEAFPPPPLQAVPFDGPRAYGETVAVDVRARMDRFYLDHCPLCGTRLGTRAEVVVLAIDGREVRLCSSSCHAHLDAGLAAARARIDAVLIADQLPHYPTRASLVDNQPLGDPPIDFVWGNRLFRARDEADRQAVLADPLAALRTLDRAVLAAQRPVYGMPDHCPVQGEILENESKIDIVVANRMIRVCCERCARMVRDRPSQYLSMIEYANREAASERAEESP